MSKIKKINKIDLTKGNILSSLFRLSFPITIIGLIQMAYNLTDMFWVGKIGANQVAAVGIVGNFVWLFDSILLMPRIGAEVNVAQSCGAKDSIAVAKYIETAIKLCIIISLIGTIIFTIFPYQLVSIFGFKSEIAIQNAVTYMRIIAIGVVFYSLSKIFFGVFGAIGNTKIGLIATGIGLLLNIILDPILILVLKLGVAGAAIGTIISQMVVFVIFLIFAIQDEEYFKKVELLKKIDKNKIKKIIKIGIPVALQSIIFATVSLVIGRMVTSYGEFAVAAQKIGVQVEAISWMTAEGFSVAVSAFVAQNYGAKNYNRIERGYKNSFYLMFIIGVIASTLLLVFPKEIIGNFLYEKEAINIGANYLKIMGYSQLFMCIEIMTNGAFSGLGKNVLSNTVSIILTIMRIPLAILLSTKIGIDGIWWSITISSILKGSVLYVFFKFSWRKKRYA